ncbi:conserved hypothetical protein [Candidatus Roizmanbacteria bacterium]|nr:conserved hypothetical protein [Candidatus Roizmanbacteria bacterium]
MDLKGVFFKVIILLFAIFYFFYTLVISKQVKTMDKTLQDKYNWIILFMTSLQVTASLIILIIVLLSILII